MCSYLLAGGAGRWAPLAPFALGGMASAASLCNRWGGMPQSGASPSSPADARVAQDSATFFALQRLEQGELQQLGDALLPWKFDQLGGLKSNGLTSEGKTRKGVPDSFVGSSAADCTLAVEYTSQQDRLIAKLEGDYTGVRGRCPHAREVFLCTNRIADETDRKRLKQLGAAHGVRVTVVDGIELADALFTDRQDLRLDHLGIPIGAHSRWTLLPSMHRRLREVFPTRIRDGLARRALPHDVATGQLNQLAARPTTVAVLAVGAAGMGKSMWAARQTLSRSETQPAFWIPAKDLRLANADPISLALVHAAFGTPDGSRAGELSELLRRERLRVLLAVDGIDEVRDFSTLLLALRDFRTAALAPHTVLLLTCRQEALPSLEEGLRAWRPDVLDPKDGTLVTLGELRRHEVDAFLQSEGGTPEEARLVTNALPPHLSGTPLFLAQALTLAKAGHVLDGERAIQSYATFALESVRERLREGGRGPSVGSLRRKLAEIAIHAIGSPTDDVPRELAEQLLGPEGGLDGEATIIGRATHSGLIETRANGAVGFQHALYLEYFAALASESGWSSPLPALASDAGRQVARRIAPYLTAPGWLIAALLPIDATTACECAAIAGTLPADVKTSLIAAIERTLDSRFPTEQSRALALLGQVSGDEARKAAVHWWNSLEPRMRTPFVSQAADTFLALEESGAFEVILQHWNFWPEHPWYEPTFVARIRRLSPAFRQAMVASARQALTEEAPTDQRRCQLVTLLALLDDQSFVAALGARVDRGELLVEAELRALVHANTEEAMEVYAKGVDNVIAIPLEDERGDTEEERQQSRSYRRDALVGHMADILMYPHDALTTLAEDALSPPHATPVMWFGESLAAFLGEERLVVPYASAMRRRGPCYFEFGNSVVESLVRRGAPSKLVELYERHEDPSIRKQIVHKAYDVPGEPTERFLLDRIKAGEFVFDAVQSLGLLRSYRAGGPILDAFRAAVSYSMRRICLRALGMIGYGPAEAALCEALRAGAGDEHTTYLIPDALVGLGGELAKATLAEVFPRARHQDAVLGALFRLRVGGAQDVATSLALEHRVSASILTEALDTFDQDDLNRRRKFGDLLDPGLLELLLADADGMLANNKGLSSYHYIYAVGRFNLPAARAFLERAAEGTSQAREAREVLAALGNERAVRLCIDAELQRCEGAQFHPSFAVERLTSWPAGMVREALLARVERGAHRSRSIFLLQWFAQPEDLALFRKIESEADISAADVAHEYLRGHRPVIAPLR